MSLQFRKDTGKWRVRFKRTAPDGKLEDIRVTLENVTSERAARNIERALTAAIKYKDYRYLDDESRRVCIQLFNNRGWTLPPALVTSVGNQGAAEELTLIKAVDYVLSDPEVLSLVDPSRHEQSFAYIIAYWGPDFPVSHMSVRQIKEYMLKRKREGASGSTINKERGALSKMFKILIEGNLADRNPVRDTAPADEKDGQRDVYISYRDFQKIVEYCACWAQAIFWTLYMTGMRRGEALSMTWQDVNLETRIIRLSAGQTKERRPKRVPIHKDLVPILQAAAKTKSVSGRVLLAPGGCPPHEDSLKKPWREAIESLELEPMPRIHDLRHCWKTNAMRSGLHPLIADAIVGHGDRKKDVRSVYLSISDEDLVREIDRMRFDLGETEIWVQK
jgi:integrase